MCTERKKYLVETYCGTCLRKDRTLARWSYDAMDMTCFGLMERFKLHLQEYNICCECRSFLEKINTFQRQAVSAMNSLNNNLRIFLKRKEMSRPGGPILSNLFKSVNTKEASNENKNVNTVANPYIKNYNMNEPDTSSLKIKTGNINEPAINSQYMNRSDANKTEKYLEFDIPAFVLNKNQVNDTENGEVHFDNDVSLSLLNDKNNILLNHSEIENNETSKRHTSNLALDEDVTAHRKNLQNKVSITKKYVYVPSTPPKTNTNYITNDTKNIRVRNDLTCSTAINTGIAKIASNITVQNKLKIGNVQSLSVPVLRVTSERKSETHFSNNVLTRETNPKSTLNLAKNVIASTNEPKAGQVLITDDILARKIGYDDMLELREKERHEEQYLKAKYKCDKCIFSFKDENLFKIHMLKHDEKYGALICGICHLRFSDIQTIESHKQSHFIDLYCKNVGCNFRSRFRSAVKCHQQSAHGVSEPIEPQPETSTVEEVQTSSKTENKNVDNVLVLRCKYKHCTRTFDNYAEFIDHEAEKHEKKKKPPLTHKCPDCPKKFRHKENLKWHIAEFHEEQIFNCKKCQKIFKCASAYVTHMKNTFLHGELRYECDWCGKKFAAKPALADHIFRIHMNITKHECSVCGKKYHKKSLKNRHEDIVHRGKKIPLVRPVCHICGKSFTCKRTLVNHMLIHSRLKPYHCPYCEWKFRQASALVVHCRYKHKDKPKPSLKPTYETQDRQQQSDTVTTETVTTEIVTTGTVTTGTVTTDTITLDIAPEDETSSDMDTTSDDGKPFSINQKTKNQD